MSSTTTTNTVDPVCGMTIDPRTAIAVVHDRATYYFCETACAETFRDQPQRWAKRASSISQRGRPLLSTLMTSAGLPRSGRCPARNRRIPAREQDLRSATNAWHIVRPETKAQARGSANRNVAPRPGPSLSTQARPPIISARALAMARPMPDPPRARERDGSIR